MKEPVQLLDSDIVDVGDTLCGKGVLYCFCLRVIPISCFVHYSLFLTFSYHNQTSNYEDFLIQGLYSKSVSQQGYTIAKGFAGVTTLRPMLDNGKTYEM